MVPPNIIIIYKTRSGVSLLISVFLVFILVLFGLGISNLVTAAIREAGSVNQSNQAYFAAEGAIEQGLLENVGKSAGYTTPSDKDLTGFCDATKGTCPKAKYKIQGKVPGGSAKIGSEYVIPSPGTGNAGADCNPLTAVKSGIFWYSATRVPHYVVSATAPTGTPPYDGYFDAIEHPCHWNKIKVGDTVAIPLYTTDVSTGSGPSAGVTETIKNPIDIDLTKLKIKFRTACQPDTATGITPEMCTTAQRYKLDGTKGDPYSLCPTTGDHLCGDVIVSWQIIGTNVNGDKIYTLVAAIPKVTKTSGSVKALNNTEIYESLINDATQGYLTSIIPGWGCADAGTSYDSGKYCVLYADNAADVLGNKFRQGKDLLFSSNNPIIDFLRNGGNYADTSKPEYRAAADKINKPVLKLTVVHSLSDIAGTIPYLEYQVTSNVGVSAGFDPADSAQTIRAEGQSGPFKQVLEVKQPQETGLLEYVIQQ